MKNIHSLIHQQIISAQKCSRCCMPLGYPGVEFHNWNEQLLCDECYSLINNEPNRIKITEKFLKLIQEIKGTGKPYDAIFAYSGGKDSTVALYSAVKEFGLKVLVLNYDNGFKGKQVIENIHCVIDDLGVDFFQIKSTTSHTIVEDIDKGILPCGRCSALKVIYPKVASTFNVKYVITGIEAMVNNEVIRDRGSFFQLNWPAALNWDKDEINRRIISTPWKDPGYGLFDTDCFCPSIAIEKIYNTGSYTNFDMYMGALEQHVVPYYSRLVRYGAISQKEFFDIIGGNLSTSDSVKNEFSEIRKKILSKK